MERYNYQNRQNRDAKYRELVTRYGRDRVTRTSLRGQLMHPQYIEDFEGPERYDTGLGNTVYRTYFAVVYSVEVKNANRDIYWGI